FKQQRRLPEPLLSTLFVTGLFRLILPRSLDGGEVDPVTFARGIEEIAKADASTAWCLCQAAGCSMSVAYLSHDVAMEIFGHDRRAVLAWGPGPGARAIAVDGGYRVTGTWSFASGGRHATWLGAHCPISEPDGSSRRTPNGKLVERTMLFPAASATFVDVWHVSGLKGMGSDAYTVDDLFVPHDHSISRDDPAERRQPGTDLLLPDGIFLRLGLRLGGPRHRAAHARRLREPRPREDAAGYKRPLANNAVIQSQVGQAEAQLSSARRFLMGSLADIWGAVGSSGTLTMDQRMLIRLASTYAIHQAKAVADVTHHAAGATSIFVDSAFDRGFRDIHAVTQQLQGRQAHFETVGQFMLGIEPDTTFL